MWSGNMFQAGKSEYLWAPGEPHKTKNIYRIKYSSVVIYYFNIQIMIKYLLHREVVNIYNKLHPNK